MKSIKTLLTSLALICVALPAFANPIVGEAAPIFSATDIHGKEINLEALKGQKVVLEWTNHLCPFVKKHYNSGNMQQTQRIARDEYNVTWISIISSGKGLQGYVSPAEATSIIQSKKAFPTTQIIDPEGTIGKLYGAQTTPHMFIINEEGTLVYKGAIDNKSSPNPKSLEGANNYVLSALNSMKAGEPIKDSITPPYGCSVKYKR